MSKWTDYTIKTNPADKDEMTTPTLRWKSYRPSPSSSDAFLDRTIISHSDKKYILGDYTKFERSSLFKICDWSEITALITNDHADKEGIAEVAKYTSVITC